MSTSHITNKSVTSHFSDRMCLGACACVCVWECMHMCVYVCVHEQVCACMCACACMHACVCVCMHACVCVCVHACTRIFVCMHAWPRVYVHMNTWHVWEYLIKLHVMTWESRSPISLYNTYPHSAASHWALSCGSSEHGYRHDSSPGPPQTGRGWTRTASLGARSAGTLHASCTAQGLFRSLWLLTQQLPFPS